jgi:hypothetical protein
MGADCIISGIRPQIAQTIVHLGLTLGEVTTKATMADAIRSDASLGTVEMTSTISSGIPDSLCRGSSPRQIIPPFRPRSRGENMGLILPPAD